MLQYYFYLFQLFNVFILNLLKMIAIDVAIPILLKKIKTPHSKYLYIIATKDYRHNKKTVATSFMDFTIRYS